MSGMVERVARAIQDVLPDWIAENGSANDIDLARAAIAAMREPSQVMIRSLDEYHDDKYVGRGQMVDTWMTMITAALNERAEGE